LSSVLEETEGVPQKWKDLHVDELVKAGWRPRIKKRGTKQYLTLRLGDQERSLGSATDENIVLFADLFPNIKEMLSNQRNYEKPSKSPGSVLSTRVAKPTPLSSVVHLSLETLQWYTWAKNTLGYPGTLDDFLNSVVKEYFGKYHKLELAVVIGKD
jgi:hypothetical protein